MRPRGLQPPARPFAALRGRPAVPALRLPPPPAMCKRAASLLLAHRTPAIAGSAATSSGGLRSLARPSPLFFSTLGAGQVRTRVEDVMPIATGLEREEIEAELQGKKRFDMDAPVGPFGTNLEENSRLKDELILKTRELDRIR